MAFKRRNMFYLNKKQETTETGEVEKNGEEREETDESSPRLQEKQQVDKREKLKTSPVRREKKLILIEEKVHSISFRATEIVSIIGEGDAREDNARRKSMAEVLVGISRTLKNQNKDKKKGFRVVKPIGEEDGNSSVVRYHRKKETKRWVIETTRRHRGGGSSSGSESGVDKHKEDEVTFSAVESTSEEEPASSHNPQQDTKQRQKTRQRGRRHERLVAEEKKVVGSKKEKERAEEVRRPSTSNAPKDEEAEEEDGDEEDSASEVSYQGEVADEAAAEEEQEVGRTMVRYWKKETYYVATTDAIINTIRIRKKEGPRPPTPPPFPEELRGDGPNPRTSFQRNFSGKKKSTKI
ncbi:hypothetical protein AAG570_010130 [Ranatra chinensis]|uniref:Uncharacterized protein n=1 Tax=Ranatra chinensis TaxID=642074 RepID=A0ABD0Z7U6_9HEMI